MYFAINNFSGNGIVNIDEYNKIKKLLDEFPEIEKIDFDQFRRYYNLSIKNLRKLKMQSLFDENTKKRCSELEKLINNEKLIYKYGDKEPVFSSCSSGTSGTSGTAGSSIYEEKFKCSNKNIIGGIPLDYIRNRLNKKFDFHKVSNNRLKLYK